jgi:hypothetical protein
VKFLKLVAVLLISNSLLSAQCTISITGGTDCVGPLTVLGPVGQASSITLSIVGTDPAPSAGKIILSAASGIVRESDNGGVYHNLIGPPGPIGAIGAPGPQGVPGATGASGAAGPAGTNGIAGATGPTGASGTPGSQGPQGPPGVPGANGAVGPIGATGAAGPQGIPGVVGLIGPAGPIGPPGPLPTSLTCVVNNITFSTTTTITLSCH